MARTEYSVTVKSVSKELSHKERVQLMDTTDCIRLDKETQVAPVVIDVNYYAELSIHNEKADDKDYSNYVVVDKSGTRYITGSVSFFSTFMDIFEEMSGADEEWQLKVYRMPSKNRQGKDFITCSIV